MNVTIQDLKAAIRSVPDFPKPGIVFRDITTLIKEGRLFRAAVDALCEWCRPKGVDAVVCMESRGFIFGAAIAYRLGAGIVPVRKKGKLPYETYSVEYELEYGTDALEMHRDAFPRGSKVLIVDDLLATGGTAAATTRLLDNLDARVLGIGFIVELSFLKGREKLSGYDVFSLIKYESEAE
ncbi:MAG: adenine phosphoribosyltransferase [Candidatus Aureabacteria bacterium]|nr:adenine phosphoribosyltransferase [Candidatus Auribacterota bacterium]